MSTSIKIEETGKAKKGLCDCLKKPAAVEEPKQNVDSAEPKITLAHHLRIAYTVGFSWVFILVGSVFSAVAGVAPLIFYLVMGDLLDQLTVVGATKEMLRASVDRLALYLFYIAIGCGAASGLSKLFLDISYEVIGIKLKRLYFERLVKQEMSFFDIKQSGSLASILSEQVAHVQDAYANKLPNIVQCMVSFYMLSILDGAQCITGIVLAFVYSWKMTLIMLASGPVFLVIVTIAGGIMKSIAEKTAAANQQAFACATEALSSMRTVRSMAGEERETARFNAELNKITKFGILKGILNSFGFGIITFAFWSVAALAFFYGGYLVSIGDLTIGAVMKVFGMMLFAVLGASQASAQGAEISKAIASASTILKVAMRVPQIRYSGGNKLDTVKGELKFDHVHFAYPTRPEANVLRDFDIKMEAGKKYALVGHSGSGKSTILGLLERFYEPKDGSKIYLDGQNLAELDPQWLHQDVIAIVTQEPTLFNCSIRDNIAYGKSNVSQEDIEKAAKIAFAHDFITQLPKGYDTLAGERGSALSGGQKQRIAIARAALRNPAVLLLDEATSALDTETEKHAQEALNVLMKGRTSIVIAHRLSTIMDADCIIVMENGIVIETGTHADLIKNPQGAYYKLAEKQMVIVNTAQQVEQIST